MSPIRKSPSIILCVTCYHMAGSALDHSKGYPFIFIPESNHMCQFNVQKKKNNGKVLWILFECINNNKQ